MLKIKLQQILFTNSGRVEWRYESLAKKITIVLSADAGGIFSISSPVQNPNVKTTANSTQFQFTGTSSEIDVTAIARSGFEIDNGGGSYCSAIVTVYE